MHAFALVLAMLTFADPEPELVVLYRFYDSKEMEHFYAYDESELKSMREDSKRYKFETPIGRVPTSDVKGTSRLWRANDSGKFYFYTKANSRRLNDAVIDDFRARVFTRRGKGLIAVHATYLPTGMDAYFDTDFGKVATLVKDAQTGAGVKRTLLKNAFYIYPLEVLRPESAQPD